MTRPREDIPSSLEIANHPPCYRKVPWACRSLWTKGFNVILQKYRQASLEADRDAQVEAVVSLLELPGNVLCYMRADRGRKRNTVIQARLERSMDDRGHIISRQRNKQTHRSEPPSSAKCGNVTVPQATGQASNVRTDQKSIGRCNSLVREGYVGRAARSLCQSGFLDPTDPEVLPILRQMHPAAQQSTPFLPVNAPYTPVTNPKKLRKFMRQRICQG